MTETTNDRYPCPDKRCPGLIPYDPATHRDQWTTCPWCGIQFPGDEIMAGPPQVERTPDPNTNGNSHVQFWCRPIKERLEQSTIGANQAAKRDLAAYAALIEGGLPPIQRATAEAFTRHLMTKRELLATPASIVAQWPRIIDELCGFFPASDAEISMHVDLYQPASLLPKYALIDAADRCIKEHDATPEPYLPDIVARHFRICPDRS